MLKVNGQLSLPIIKNEIKKVIKHIVIHLLKSCKKTMILAKVVRCAVVKLVTQQWSSCFKGIMQHLQVLTFVGILGVLAAQSIKEKILKELNILKQNMPSPRGLLLYCR